MAHISVPNGGNPIYVNGGVDYTNTPYSADGTIEKPYVTIQGALTAQTSGGELFIVAPGTYDGDTINFTASNQVVRGMADQPKKVLITSTETQIINIGAHTGCSIAKVKCVVSAATSAISIITGTGDCTFYRTHFSIANAATIAAVTQPSIVSGTGTFKFNYGTWEYDNKSAHAPAIKAPALPGALGKIYIDNLKVTILGSNAAVVSTLAFDTTGSGIVTLNSSSVTATDAGAQFVVGYAYLNGSGSSECKNNDIHVTGGTVSAIAVFLLGGTPAVRCMFNHIHVIAGGGTALSFNVAGGSLISQGDDIIAANGYTHTAGTLSIMSSLADGALTATGNVEAATFSAAGNAGLTGTMTVNDSATINFSLTFVGGILTGHTESGADCAWS